MTKKKTRIREKPGPTVADLFCGAGGLSHGLTRAGFQVVFAADHWASAVQTYRANHGDHVAELEIGEDAALPPVELIVGGPPCQGFSSAGLRKSGDKRNTLVGVFARIIARERPRAFVFENVEGFLTGDKGQRVLELLEPLIEAGYRVHLRKVNAANFGVPQHRKRVLAIGGLGVDLGFPEPSHWAFGAPGAENTAAGLPPTPSVEEALAGLPKAASKAPGEPSDHVMGKVSEQDGIRISALRPGQRMRDLPEELWHDTYRRRAHRRVQDGTPTERRGGAPAGIRRLVPTEPSKAITSGARTELIHPRENRPLTLRECARLQTFPDTYGFEGSLGDRMLQIANAVPPTLGFAVASHVRKMLRETECQQREGGALLSFVPTLASGMSPALKATVDCVASRFGIREVQQEFLVEETT